MSEKNNLHNDPAAKVERMNRIFDHVVLPMILFTVVMFIVSAFVFKPESCVSGYADDLTPVENVQPELDAYLMREVLLEDMAANRSIFEQGGYTIVESEQSGLVAFRQADEHTQIFENIADNSGSHYSAIVREKDGVTVTVRVYSENIFLVEAQQGETVVSAIFRDDLFTSWISGGDADAAAVMGIVPGDQLRAIIGDYKAGILALVSSDKSE